MIALSYEERMSFLTCFKAYDIRGKIGLDIDESIMYRIGRALAQHFNAKSIIVGRDVRKTSNSFAMAAADGIMAAGSNVIDIGCCGTEEMYWAVSEFGACAGVEITASHNPIDYNGMKIVKSGSQPLDKLKDFNLIKLLAENELWASNIERGSISYKEKQARDAYIKKVLSFVDIDVLKPQKIVVNSGNGAAGPTFDAIAEQLIEKNVPIEFIRVNHIPDSSFPNGIPNPIISENHPAPADIVKLEKADCGIAFDGDFDRCFFFDEFGRFNPGEYIVGVFASIFLEKEKGAKIVHDPRVIWNTQDIVSQNLGYSILSKTGHAFIKKTMRKVKAIYGGEMSAHHYFRDFAYCDSGMIPWLLMAELLSKSDQSLANLIKDRFAAFPSSGEKNFKIEDPQDALSRVYEKYKSQVIEVDHTDGMSLTFENWRFNLRKSNTEPLVRLNVETKGTSTSLDLKIAEIIEELSV